MDRLLTVPKTRIEILLVKKLCEEEFGKVALLIEILLVTNLSKEEVGKKA